MLFNSLQFIFLFLPAAVLVFYLCQKINLKLPIISLALFSLFFYAYWNPPYILLLLSSISVNFIFASLIKQKKKHSFSLLCAAIIFNLALLFYYKYAGFFLQNYQTLIGVPVKPLEIILPIGISFFTFQQIAYQVDMYKDKVTSHHFWEYALFVTFFPQLIAGPIVHHSEMIPQFLNRKSILFRIENISVGLTIFMIGLFKKVVLADNLALHATPVFSDALAGQSVDFYAAWIAALSYTFQLYFDFSGYSDMAIGAARLFGIRLPINFFSPYKSASIIDFWRRWHMTLSRFFRDYLYIPLGGNRKGKNRQLFNIFIVMTLVGFWHGAGWTFIIWGAFHGTLIVINHLWRRYTGNKEKGAAIHILSFLLTFLLVVIGWVIFRAGSLEAALIVLQSMFGLQGLSLPVHFFHAGLPSDWGIAVSTAGAKGTLAVIIAMLIAFLAPNTIEIMRRYRPATLPDYLLSNWSLVNLIWRPVVLWAVFTGALFIWAISGILSGQSEFLYFDF
jgi:alginate O-acetyltransferase complex protein AlgI